MSGQLLKVPQKRLYLNIFLICSIICQLTFLITLQPEQERAIKKFFMTMVLNDLWHLKTVSETSITFGIDRGVVQNLMGMAAIEASCLLKFCEELEEFWAFRELFKNLSQRLANICTVELVPLMQLPSVKMVRTYRTTVSGIGFLFQNIYRYREEQSNCTTRDTKKLKM